MKLAISDYNRASTIVTEAVGDVLALGAAAAGQYQRRGRQADADRIMRMVTGVVEDPMRIVVVGEFKSGKSSLINALLGTHVLATHPIESTTYRTEVRYGDEPHTHVDRLRDGAWSSVEVDAATGRDLELGRHPSGDDTIEAIRTTVRAPLLASGLTLVDTPSMSGGITSPEASAVLAELQTSQAWMFVTDSSQELTGPELELVRIGCSLCPVVMVVETKCDLNPHWRRLAGVDEQHLAGLGLELPPVIVPTSAPLRDTALRVGDPKLDHESGLPLLTWYLTRVTTVTARASRTVEAAAVLAGELEALETSHTDEIDLVLNSGDRAAILAQAEQARLTVERLAQSARFAIEREVRKFRRKVTHDLQDRVAALRRATGDDLADMTHERDWPKIEQQVQTDVNRLFAAHLQRINEAIGEAVQQVADELTIAATEIDVTNELQVARATEAHVSAQLDAPEMPSNPMSRLQPAIVSARVGVTGAAGVGAVHGLLSGAALLAGFVAVPVVAAGAGWWVWNNRKSSNKTPWRQQAEHEINRFLNDCQQLIGRRSDDIADDVAVQLKAMLEQRLLQLGEGLAIDIKRLTEMAGDRENVHRDQLDRLHAERDEAKLLATHARRIGHLLESPTITLPLHVADAASFDGTSAE